MASSANPFKPVCIRQSLEKKKENILLQATNHLDVQRNSIKKSQQKPSRPRDSFKASSKAFDHQGNQTEDLKVQNRTHPVLIHQATSESLVSNTIGKIVPISPLPKDRPMVFDHRLNNKFKMIDYFEHDQNLVNTKNEYRVGLLNKGKIEGIQESCQR